jgi:hypothetical protein
VLRNEFFRAAPASGFGITLSINPEILHPRGYISTLNHLSTFCAQRFYQHIHIPTIVPINIPIIITAAL